MVNEVSRGSHQKFGNLAQLQALIYVVIDGNNGEFLPAGQRCQQRVTLAVPEHFPQKPFANNRVVPKFSDNSEKHWGWPSQGAHPDLPKRNRAAAHPRGEYSRAYATPRG